METHGRRPLLRDEEEKAKIQKELTTLTERLSRLNEDIARKMQVRARVQRGCLLNLCVCVRG